MLDDVREAVIRELLRLYRDGEREASPGMIAEAVKATPKQVEDVVESLYPAYVQYVEWSGGLNNVVLTPLGATTFGDRRP